MGILKNLNKYVGNVKTVAVFIGGIVAALLAFSDHYEKNFGNNSESQNTNEDA